MEIRQYIFLVRKWLWLLILGGIIGASAAYLYSDRQTRVYQTRTRVMVLSAPSTQSAAAADYGATYNDIQLARAYSTLIAATPVLNSLSEKLGYRVSASSITVRQIENSVLIDITIRHSNPQRAADIANSLYSEFSLYNETIQKERFASSEETLLAQIAQVETQLSAIAAQVTDDAGVDLKTEQDEIDAQMVELETQISDLKAEISELNAAAGSNASAINQAAAKQRELDILESRLRMYQEIFVNLVVMNDTNSAGASDLRESQIRTTEALYQQIYTSLLNNYEQVRLARLRSTPSIIQIDPANVPGSPISPQPRRDAVLGLVVGLIVMAAVAFAIEYLDDTIKTPEDINRLLNLPIIGLIGEMEKSASLDVFTAANPRSPIAEAFRTLRTNLDFAGVDKPLRSLLVTSSGPSEGKSTIATNLSVVMSQGERKVTLIDADMRRPSLHKQLQVPNRQGLSDVLRHPETLEENLIEWGQTNPIRVLTSGALPPNPAELLGSTKMSELIATCQQTSDIVIIDSPPFVVSDPIILSAKVDGVVLVIEPGGTKIDMARTMLEQLERSGARVIGVVLNPISRKSSQYYSGRYRYYSEYYSYRSYGDHENGGKAEGKGDPIAKQPSTTDPASESSLS